MKKLKFFVAISVFIGITGFVISTTIFATNTKLLNKAKITSIDEAYVEVKNVSTVKTNAVAIAKSLLSDFGISTQDTKSTYKVKQYNNNLLNRQETGVFGDDYIVKYNSNTQDLISFVNNSTSFTTNTLSNTEIRNVAYELFNNIKLTDYKEYKLVSLIKFDDEIYSVKFAKYYGDLINYGESVNFSFAPADKEIVTLAVNSIIYANNKININENEAIAIATQYAKNKELSNPEIKIDIVHPNYKYVGISEGTAMYKTINQTRKAYVITLDEETKSVIYIDCTTGEIIGGDSILGGVL